VAMLMLAFYCDDGIIIARHEILQRVLQFLRTPEARSYGTAVRLDKCSVWWPASPSQDIIDAYADLTVTTDFSAGTMILQAPVGDRAYMSTMVFEQVKEMRPMLQAISEMEDMHVAFFLLRTCFGCCRMAYTLRTVPPSATARGAQLFDSMIELALRRLLGGSLPTNTFKELQLPVNTSTFGVGLTSAVLTASAAYFASVADTIAVTNALLDPAASFALEEDNNATDAFNLINTQTPEGYSFSWEDVTGMGRMQQREIMKKLHKRAIDDIEKGTIRDQAMRSLLRIKGSKDWLRCAPAPGLGTYIADRDFRVWFRYWCRLPLFGRNTTCPRENCNEVMDVYGDHLLSCTHAAGPSNTPHRWRHDSLLRNMTATLQRAGRLPEPERRHKKTANSRPDIKCMGEEGCTDYLELTFTNPLSNDRTLKAAVNDPYAIVRKADRAKCAQHQEVLDDCTVGSQLIIVVITVLGGWSGPAREYFKHAAVGSASMSQDKASYGLCRIQ